MLCQGHRVANHSALSRRNATVSCVDKPVPTLVDCSPNQTTPNAFFPLLPGTARFDRAV